MLTRGLFPGLERTGECLFGVMFSSTSSESIANEKLFHISILWKQLPLSHGLCDFQGSKLHLICKLSTVLRALIIIKAATCSNLRKTQTRKVLTVQARPSELLSWNFSCVSIASLDPSYDSETETPSDRVLRQNSGVAGSRIVGK